MEELLRDLVAVCERHGMEVLIDSGMLELGTGGELIFRCRDLNMMREEYFDAMRLYDEMEMMRYGHWRG